jgi:hypothetical protein
MGQKPESLVVTLFKFVMDVVFCADVALQFFVSFKDVHKRWVRMPNLIVRSYLFGNFVFDVVSVLPYDAFTHLCRMRWGSEVVFVGVIQLLGLFKLTRLNRTIARHESSVSIPYVGLKFAKIVASLVMILHWMACLWGFLLYYERTQGMYDGHTWIDGVRVNKPGMFTHRDSETPFEIYAASLYWSCMTITSIGYGDVTATNVLESFVATFCMCVSGMVWAQIIGSVCAICSAMEVEAEAHESLMLSLNTMMHHLKLPSDSQVQLREYFMCRKAMTTLDQQRLLMQDMSPDLQAMVARWIQGEHLERVWFCRDAGDEFVVGLFKSFQFSLYPPKELVRLHGCFVSLLQGVALRGARIVPSGSMWGMDDLCLSNPRLWDDRCTLALSYIQVQYIQQKSFADLLQDHPNELAVVRSRVGWIALRRALQKRSLRNWLVDMRDGGEKLDMDRLADKMIDTFVDHETKRLMRMSRSRSHSRASGLSSGVRSISPDTRYMEVVESAEDGNRRLSRRVAAVEDKLDEVLKLLRPYASETGSSLPSQQKVLL